MLRAGLRPRPCTKITSRRRLTITTEEKLERAREARAAAAAKRSAEIERAQLAEISEEWDQIAAEDQRKFDYIRKQIASGRRDHKEIAALRETRALHFRKYQTKEARNAA